MKFAHISDLHIGKRLNGFPLLDDQIHILGEIIDIIVKSNCDGVIIAGDVYDKSTPSSEAVSVFNDFLTTLSRKKLTVYIISGNHDSPQRIAYGAEIMQTADIYVSPVYDGTIKKITKEDEFGKINIFLCPFVKPMHVRRFFPDEPTDTYTQAMQTLISHTDIDKDERNIFVCHQFITGAAQCDSEDISVGTLDNIDAQIFDVFDYVALGHIHSAQNVYRSGIRYCGTPLKYSFSECRYDKSVTLVTFKEKGSVTVETVPLSPLHDMREIKGDYLTLMDKKSYTDENKTDYLRVTLTDEEEIPNVLDKLRSVYPNIMQLDFDNSRTASIPDFSAAAAADTKSPLELFEDFYLRQNGREMSSIQKDFCTNIIQKVWSDEI